MLRVIISSKSIETSPNFIMFYRNKVSKVGDRSLGWPEGSLFNSYCTDVLGRVQLLSLDCSTLPLIRTLYCCVLSKEVSSTIIKVFGMTRPGTEPRKKMHDSSWFSVQRLRSDIIHENYIITWPHLLQYLEQDDWK